MIAALLAGALAGGLLVGCASSTDGGTAQPGESMSSTSPESQSPHGLPPTGRVYPPSPTPTTYQEGEMTLTGEVQVGVEYGCLVMKAGDRTYLLLGGDRQLVRAGNRITVRGKPNPGMITTCQQGTPFEIIEARAA
jgi:hypothetical protein